MLQNMLTSSDGWSLLLVAGCRRALLHAPVVEQLLAAAQEGLLLLLGVSCQHLLGQPQAPVGFLLLAGWRHHANALCHILNYFY